MVPVTTGCTNPLKPRSFSVVSITNSDFRLRLILELNSTCFSGVRNENLLTLEVKGKGKAIPVTDRGRPYVCETSRLPQFIDNRLKGGGEVVSLTCRQPFTPKDDSWCSFPLEAESTPEP
jgi:hypothetical protein